MKYFLIILTLTISHNIIAQKFGDNTSEWHFRYFNQTLAGCVKLKYEKDTLINGHIYKEYFKHYDIRNSLSGTESQLKIKPEYLRADSGKVYVWLNEHNKFTKLFDFNLEIGDTWEIDLAKWPIKNKSKIICTVLETGFENYNSEVLNWQKVNFYIDDIYKFDDIVYERFGLSIHALFPWDEFYGHADGNELGYFIRYLDETLDYNTNSFSNCDESTLVNEQISRKRILYPNPVSDILQIRNIEKDDHFELFDQNGLLINEGKLQSQIEMINYNDGLYYIQIYNSNRSVVYKILKI